jgi:hypothetical protein
MPVWFLEAVTLLAVHTAADDDIVLVAPLVPPVRVPLNVPLPALIANNELVDCAETYVPVPPPVAETVSPSVNEPAPPVTVS